ncbi:uncharacterized protein ACO6RY_01217 [Pungitius sinensis]
MASTTETGDGRSPLATNQELSLQVAGAVM